MLRALDLFCGAGGVSMGLRRAGFEVTGVDRRPQPRYPFTFIQAGAMTFPLEGYDLIWASPPCQAHTALRSLPNAKEHPDLIPEVRARLKASGLPYVIENVPGAPLLQPVRLCGTMFGLQTEDGRAELRRHRLFETNLPILILTPPCAHRRFSIPVYGGGDQGWDQRRRNYPKTIGVYGHTGGAFAKEKAQRFLTKDRKYAMGIDWMTNEKLSQAIPPAYAEHIGHYATMALCAFGKPKGETT